MSEWTDFPNWTHGEKFSYLSESDAQYITEASTHVLRPEAHQAIRLYPGCAEQFLRLLASGGLDLRGQEGIAELLLEIGRQSRHSLMPGWRDLQVLLRAALDKLS